MGNGSLWAIIWLIAAASFGIGELVVAGSFFLLPFAAGAAAAALLSLIHPILGWVGFIVVSFVSFLLLRPLGKKLEENAPNVAGIGSNRLVGSRATVIDPIPAMPGGDGLVKVGTEEWRADSRDGVQIHAGSIVHISKVKGTRLVVHTED